jgi:hypothetical protein
VGQFDGHHCTIGSDDQSGSISVNSSDPTDVVTFNNGAIVVADNIGVTNNAAILFDGACAYAGCWVCVLVSERRTTTGSATGGVTVFASLRLDMTSQATIKGTFKLTESLELADNATVTIAANAVVALQADTTVDSGTVRLCICARARVRCRHSHTL